MERQLKPFVYDKKSGVMTIKTGIDFNCNLMCLVPPFH